MKRGRDGVETKSEAEIWDQAEFQQSEVTGKLHNIQGTFGAEERVSTQGAVWVWISLLLFHRATLGKTLFHLEKE